MSILDKKDIIFKLIYNPNEKLGEKYKIISGLEMQGFILNDKDNDLRIFGKEFVKHNKKNCKIIYNNKRYELKEYFKDIDKDYKNKEIIKLKLIINNGIINMSEMFYECYHLISISEYLKKKNNQNYTNNIFSTYNLDSSFNKENQFNDFNITNNSIYMENSLFSLSISSIQDINTFNSESNSLTQNNELIKSLKLNHIHYISGMFIGCISLNHYLIYHI